MSPAPRSTILVGDALYHLRRLPSATVDCVITSPPYYHLRDYGVPGQLGTEPHVDGWVESLAAVLHELARVLKPTGSIWLNLGDSYSTHARYGAPPKGLLLAPERLLLALAADGWIVRNKVVWAKPNAAPSSVRDRLNATYEPLYFLVRQRRYHFDLDAVRAPYRSGPQTRRARRPGPAAEAVGVLAQPRLGLLRSSGDRNPLGKNPGDVWTIPPKPYPGGHFATFPPALVERPLLATCPRWACADCGLPWLGEQPSCRGHEGRIPGLVLDPFLGSGTVAVVAEHYGRDWLGIELNPVYATLARDRLSGTQTAQERAA